MKHLHKYLLVLFLGVSQTIAQLNPTIFNQVRDIWGWNSGSFINIQWEETSNSKYYYIFRFDKSEKWTNISPSGISVSKITDFNTALLGDTLLYYVKAFSNTGILLKTYGIIKIDNVFSLKQMKSQKFYKLSATHYKDNITTNDEFLNSASMTESQIQEFLENIVSGGSCLATYSSVDVDGVTRTAAQMIYNASQNYFNYSLTPSKINPQAILTTLQKEQLLITTQGTPTDSQLKKAMGYEDPNNYYFAKQIDAGSWQFRKNWQDITSNGSKNGWGVGIAKTSEDGVSVTPENMVTADLYVYTPVVGYQWGGNNANFGGNYLYYNIYYNQFNFGTTVDNPPVVSSFLVTPTSIAIGNTVTISYSVMDDIGLQQVELWRTVDSSGAPKVSAWTKMQTTNLSSQTSYSGSFSDVPTSIGDYWYGVHVVDTKGNWSPEPKPPGPTKVTVNPQPVSPTVQTIAATKIGSSSATLNASVNPNWGSTVVWFQYSEGSGFVFPNTSETPAETLATGATAIQISSDINGLSPSVQYYFRVVAFNSAGTSFGEAKSFYTIALGAPIVQTIAATNINSNLAQLNGTIISNGGDTWYHFEWGITANYGSNSGESGPNYWTIAHPVQYTVIPLTSGTIYHFKLVARNSSGTSYGDDMTFTTLSVVPVELSSFIATLLNNYVKLTWRTETEINNYGFEIERRKIIYTPERWDKIGFVTGSGTSNSPHEYSFMDNELSPGRSVYRLKQIDNSGSFKYYGNVEVEILAPTKFSLYQNFPNPFNPSTVIRYALPSRSFVRLGIFNMLGQCIQELLNSEQDAGYREVIWQPTVSTGLYIYRIEAIAIDNPYNCFVEKRKALFIK